jgi:hypothetical protein
MTIRASRGKIRQGKPSKLSSAFAPVAEGWTEVFQCVACGAGLLGLLSVCESTFCRTAAEPCGPAAGINRREATGEQRAAYAGKHIPLSSARHAGMAGGVDSRIGSGSGGQGAGALEEQGAGMALDEAKSGLFAWKYGQIRCKAGELSRVRRDQVMGRKQSELAGFSEQIQSIGIEDRGYAIAR